MTWFKVDDQLAFHSKAVEAGNTAMGLWVRAGAWAAAHLTDGFVPNRIVILLAEGDSSQIESLVAARLWVPRDGGYQFHDWGDQQPTSHDVKERRRRDAERQAEWRDRRKQVRRGATDPSGVTDEGVPPESQRDTASKQSSQQPDAHQQMDELSQRDSALPGPTRPDPKGSVATHLGEVAPTGEGGAGGEPSRKRSGASSRGTRLPDDWAPSEPEKQWVRENCIRLTDRQKHVATQDFCDYWHAKAGKEANKLDWSLTYKRWMRKNNEEAPEAGRPGRGGVGSSARSTTDERVGALDLYYEVGPEQPQLGD